MEKLKKKNNYEIGVRFCVNSTMIKNMHFKRPFYQIGRNTKRVQYRFVRERINRKNIQKNMQIPQLLIPLVIIEIARKRVPGYTAETSAHYKFSLYKPEISDVIFGHVVVCTGLATKVPPGTDRRPSLYDFP